MMTLSFPYAPGSQQEVPSGGMRIPFYIDLSQVASLVNRRFYRQGINWAVGGIKIITGIQSGGIEVAKLPNTWVMANSYEKSLRAWLKMNRQVMEETPSVRPRFLDFKIYADDEHHLQGFQQNLLPAAARPDVASFYQPGEWLPSKVIVPNGPPFPGNTSEFEFIATGASFPGVGSSGLGAVSLIEGYAASRGLPYNPDPNAPRDADDSFGVTPENWMSAIFNEGTDQSSEVIEDMITENNQPPYPFENDGLNVDTMYPGGANQAPGLQLHDVNYWTNTNEFVVNQHRIKGGNFPCGLIKFNMTNTGTSKAGFSIIIDLVPGNHRGYLCESMTEM